MRVVIEAGELLRAKAEVEEEEKAEKAEEEEAREGEGAAEERTVIDDLASFLSERLGRDVLISGDELSLEVEEAATRRRVKQLLKKFLYKQGLDEELRVISLGEGVFRIKRRRFPRLKAPSSPWS